jgi:hypothetical protein
VKTKSQISTKLPLNVQRKSKVWYNNAFNVQHKNNSVAWIRERTTPTEQQQLVDEVSANFCGQRVPRAAWRIPIAVFSVFYTGSVTFSYK